MKRTLALDFGEKRMGVAISDSVGLFACPFPAIIFQNTQNSVKEIKKICEHHHIKQIIIGLPLNLKGEVGFQAKKVKQFATILQKELHLPLIFQDERFSSLEAKKILGEKTVRNKKEKIDSISAQIILQQYLERQNVQ